MRPGALWLGSALLLSLSGAPLLADRRYRGFSLPARVVLAGACGAVLLSLAMTLFAMAGWRWRPLPLLVISLFAATALRFLLPMSPAPGSGLPSPRERWSAASAILSALAVAVALAGTLAGAAGSSDLLLFWGPKTVAFAGAGTIDADFLAAARNAHMHPYYPPLVTNLYSFGAIVAGRFPWGAAALTFPLALGALALALPSALRLSTLRPAAGAALAVSALALIGLEADVAGNADPPLLLFEILAVGLLLGPPGIETERQLLAGLLLAGASTTKVEGLVFTLTVVLVVLLRPAMRGFRGRALALLLGPTALALGVWFLLGLSRGFLRTYGEYGSLLDSDWRRVGAVAGELLRAFAADGWALPFLVPLAVLLWNWRDGVDPLPLLVSVALTLFLVATYLLPVGDPGPWIRWSAVRTFSPVAALLAIAGAGRRDGHANRRIVANPESAEIHHPSTKERGQ